MAWMKEKRNVVNRVNQAVNLVICTGGFFWSVKYWHCNELSILKFHDFFKCKLKEYNYAQAT